MSEPFATTDAYRDGLLCLGRLLCERHPEEEVISRYEEFTRAMQGSGTLFPLARLREVFSLERPQELGVILYLYRSGYLSAVSIQELGECCRRFGGHSLPEGLFLRVGSEAVMRPIAADFLAGRPPRLPDGARLTVAEPDPSPYGAALLAELEQFCLCALREDDVSAVVALWGRQGSGRRFLFSQLAGRLGAGMLEIAPVPEVLQRQEDIALACMLYEAVPCLLHYTEQQGALLERLLGSVRLVLLHADAPIRIPHGRADAALVREVPPLHGEEKLQAMRNRFAGIPLRVSEACWRQIAFDYPVTPGLMEEAAAMLWGEALAQNEPVQESRFRSLLLREEERGAPTGTKRMSCQKTLDDLVLPPEQTEQFKRICGFAKIRGMVYGNWGFAQKVTYGKGISVLLYGASGTGKTMAATVLAAELGRELYRVDLAQIISKYIGETQKSMGAIFDEAANRDCVLLFDEADALFARRSEMNDSQDKYSNAEIAYLLQRMEEYDGISILATNLLQNFDEAFRRRINYMIHFPLPDAAMRLRLWKGIFPEQAPLGKLDLELLAREFELSGASIKNCALHAAYMAALEGTEIVMPYLIEAVRNEYAKVGKTIGAHVMQRVFL